MYIIYIIISINCYYRGLLIKILIKTFYLGHLHLGSVHLKSVGGGAGKQGGGHANSVLDLGGAT